MIAVLAITTAVALTIAVAAVVDTRADRRDRRTTQNHQEMFLLINDLLVRDRTAIPFMDEETKKRAVTLTAAYRKATTN